MADPQRAGLKHFFLAFATRMEGTLGIAGDDSRGAPRALHRQLPRVGLLLSLPPRHERELILIGSGNLTLFGQRSSERPLSDGRRAGPVHATARSRYPSGLLGRDLSSEPLPGINMRDRAEPRSKSVLRF
jgi:hypothetical protein